MIEGTLAAALLWLRNHYDVGKPELKKEVLARIDSVLKQREPTFSEMREFRRDFPNQ
jgi:hypothetical protein